MIFFFFFGISGISEMKNMISWIEIKPPYTKNKINFKLFSFFNVSNINFMLECYSNFQLV